jgi:UDP-2-acetamido-3-amino-2,3-dideoxy-glucuronate N-acetyltransferase
MTDVGVYVHALGICDSTTVGRGSRIWAFAHILAGARIGEDCNICDHVFIENDVVVGDRVTIKSGVQLWDGVQLGDDVFVGPNATFSNDPFPRSKAHLAEPMRTIVEAGASIGANATIVPGCRIGRHAMVGAGAVVTRDIPPYAVVTGNPAQVTRYAHDGSTRRERDHHAPQIEDSGMIEIPSFSDERGLLSVLEEGTIPFRVSRIFFVYDVPNRLVRGEHAHVECHQLLICTSGALRVHLDSGRTRRDISLSSPTYGVHIPPMTWASQYQFTPGTVLAVLASHPYDPDDYIRSYDDFLAALEPAVG